MRFYRSASVATISNSDTLVGTAQVSTLSPSGRQQGIDPGDRAYDRG